MTTTNKGGGSIPGSKNRFDVKPEIFVLQVDRGAEATQGSTDAKKHLQQSRKYLLKYRPTWVLNSYWVIQYYRDPRARHFD